MIRSGYSVPAIFTACRLSLRRSGHYAIVKEAEGHVEKSSGVHPEHDERDGTKRDDNRGGGRQAGQGH